MRNTCPKCGTPYAVNASVVGRTFTCKKCGTPLIVTEEGLDYKTPAAAAPAATPAGAFNFDNTDAADNEAEARPAKVAKSKRRGREDDEEDDVRGKKKAKVVRDDDEDEDDYKPKSRAKSPREGGSKMGEYLSFRQFVTPVVIQIIFWLLTAVVVLGALGFGVVTLLSGEILVIIGTLIGLLIAVPFYILLIRIYCEVLLIVFRIHDRLGEIREALPKREEPPLGPSV